ncbi:hypothetical protein L6Q79_14710 [bacterium]|nr:hypothetical protein [bacterium]NUN46286.1 hypothetical protein [bacterium]
MKPDCCKNYKKKGKACRECPVLAKLRERHADLRRKEVFEYLQNLKRNRFVCEVSYES